MIVFAHAGHWLPQLLYLAPVAIMLGALGLGKLRARRQNEVSQPRERESSPRDHEHRGAQAPAGRGP